MHTFPLLRHVCRSWLFWRRRQPSTSAWTSHCLPLPLEHSLGVCFGRYGSSPILGVPVCNNVHCSIFNRVYYIVMCVLSFPWTRSYIPAPIEDRLRHGLALHIHPLQSHSQAPWMLCNDCSIRQASKWLHIVSCVLLEVDKYRKRACASCQFSCLLPTEP